MCPISLYINKYIFWKATFINQHIDYVSMGVTKKNKSKYGVNKDPRDREKKL